MPGSDSILSSGGDSEASSERKRTGFRLFRGRNRKRDEGVDSDNPSKQRQVVVEPVHVPSTKNTSTTKKIAFEEVAKHAAPTAKTTMRSPATTTMKKPVGSFLCRTKQFRHLCDVAFKIVDADGSGTVDEKELYSGLLLIHLQLGMYAGPAACRPLDRQQCSKVFHLMDADKSGALDKEEFQQVMMVLFSNVLLRVLTLWSMTIMIVPLVSQKILDGMYWLYAAISTFVASLDVIELSPEGTSRMENWISSCSTDPFLELVEKGKNVLSIVPDSIWNTIPLTLLSTILGTLVVPWLLLKIDAFFHSVADKKQRSKIVEA